MPVVAKVPNGPYVMVIESLSGPRPEIVMFTSNDGKAWGNRSLVANADHDGGKGVGCPYVVGTNDYVYASFHHTFSDALTGRDYSQFQIRVLNKSLAKDSNNRLVKIRDIAFEMRPSKTADNIGLYYWGSINVVGNHVVGLAAGGTLHRSAEAWIPLD